MADQQSSGREPEARDQAKRPWVDPTLEAIPIADAEGTPAPPPGTDGVTAHS